MKRTAIKLTILIAAIALAVGGVLLFLRTIVSPPTDSKSTNAHEADIVRAMENYSPGKQSLSEAEKALDNLHDRATLFYTDSLINDEVHDNVVATSSNAFATVFTDWCFEKFGQSVWSAKDHQQMSRIISKLRKKSISHGTKKAVNPQFLSSMTKIETVIADYNAAWRAAKNTKYSSLADSESKIKAADSYRTADYLCNCTSLVSALSKVRSNLEQSHYNYLVRLVNSLGNYRSMSKAEYENWTDDVIAKLNEYKSDATRVYGANHHSVSDLEAKCHDFYQIAMDYYEQMDNSYYY